MGSLSESQKHRTAIANASQTHRKTSPAPETEAEAATERSLTTRVETFHHGVGLGDARGFRDEMMPATRQGAAA